MNSGLTPMDRAVRATGIGASEAWRIVLNEGAHDVYLRLVHPDLVEPLRAVAPRKGLALEPLIADLYAERTGALTLRTSGTLRHPKHAHVLATPDRLRMRDDDPFGVEIDRVVQIKAPTFRSRDEWGPDGSDLFPLRYRLQVTIEMAVTGVHRADLVALVEGEDEIRVFDVPYDRELADLAIDEIESFYARHVAKRVPPPADGSHAAAAYLAKRYPRNRGTMRPADDDDRELARELADVKAQIKRLEERERQLTNAACARTQDADGVEGLWSWTLPASGAGRTAWRDVARALGAPAHLITAHTSAPARVFRLTGANDK